MKFLELPIDRPVAVVMFLLSLMVLGGVAVTRLPLDFMPLIKEPEVDIEVPFPGSHPLETLREVAMPIEEEVATIPGVKRIKTRANSGQARIEVQFDWSANIDLKRLEVREAVERARGQLPEGLGNIRVEGDVDGPGDGATLQGRISAERNLAESWDLLERRIKRPLERIKGVARVDLYGVEAQQVRVDIDLQAMREHGLSAQDVMGRLESENVDMDLGTLRGDVVRYDVRSVGRFRDVDSIRNLRIGDEGLRIRDVAEVTKKEPRLDYGRHLDLNFAIGIDVFKEPSANTVETVDRLMERIDEIDRDPALEGIQLLVWSNAGEEIRNSLSGLLNAGVFGGVLAIAVLFLFLRKLSTTGIIAVAIPFSILVTCGGMYALGADLNVLTMLGLMLGIGMLVDNAVVVIENIFRMQGKGLAAKEAVKKGVSEVALPVLASTATTVIVWSWLLVTERGPLQIYMGEMALIICLSVACSLLISLTFIPLAACRFRPRGKVEEGFLLGRVVPFYRRILAWTLRHRLAALIALLGLAGSAAIPIARLEKSGEPKMRQSSVQINYRVYEPSTKEVLETYVDELEAFLIEKKDELQFDSMYSWYSENRGVMTRLYLPPSATNEEGVARMRKKLEEELPVIPGVELKVGDREWWRNRGGGDGSRRVAVAIKGEDPEYLEELAIEAEDILSGIPDAVDVFGPSLDGLKEARILVDPERARAFGVDPEQIAQTVAFTYRGRRLRPLRTNQGEVEIRLGLPENMQPGLSSLNDIQIVKDQGGSVPLNSVASVEIARMRPTIQRTNRQTTQWVSAQFPEEITTDEAKEKVATALKGFHLPEGYHWDFGEWGERRDETLATMTRGVTLSLIIVILLMAALFESFSQPLAIIITLPLAFFGAFWSLWVFGYELDSMAFIGVIILIGIVVNNGIVMVDHVNQLRREGMDRVDALLAGCGHRLRPVLMTAITTIFGLLPLTLSGFTVANVFIDSLAVAVLGGLVSSTLFTLVALPVWYTTVEDIGSLAARFLPRRDGASSLPLPKGAVLVQDERD